MPKRRFRQNVSEYLLKPVTAVELTEVLKNMYQTLENCQAGRDETADAYPGFQRYKKNEQLIRSQALSSLVTGSKEPETCVKQMEELGIFLKAPEYRIAVVEIDIYSGLYEQSLSQRQESALMAFVVYNISDEVVRKHEAGIVYQEANSRIGILFRRLPEMLLIRWEKFAEKLKKRSMRV